MALPLPVLHFGSEVHKWERLVESLSVNLIDRDTEAGRLLSQERYYHPRTRIRRLQLRIPNGSLYQPRQFLCLRHALEYLRGAGPASRDALDLLRPPRPQKSKSRRHHDRQGHLVRWEQMYTALLQVYPPAMPFRFSVLRLQMPSQAASMPLGCG